MDDLISRQAAIDALEQIFDRCEEIEAHLPEGDPDRTGYKMYPDYMTVWKYLHQLPSAQPDHSGDVNGKVDLIDRQAAIREYQEVCKGMKCGECPLLIKVNTEKGSHLITDCKLEAFLHDLPSAQPDPHWIPCSERLPEEGNKSYWICTDGGYQYECRWTNVNHFWTNLTTDWHWHIMDVPQYSKVVAWMPLPEPYREERTEE